MASLKSLLVFSAAVLGVALPEHAAPAPATACTTGKPTTTAGFPMLYYTQVTPIATSFKKGYEPHSKWASQHLVGTYTFGVPEPVESGFAYAQFKCQYYCGGRSPDGGGSFFVRGDRKVGSHCNCYDKLVDPMSFVNTNQTLVGAWNSICSTK